MMSTNPGVQNVSEAMINRLHGDSVLLECDPSFRVITGPSHGVQEIICTDGEWSGATLECRGMY